MSRSIFLFFVVFVIAAGLWPVNAAYAQPTQVEGAVVQGVLTFDRRYVAVQPISPDRAMRLVLRFDPQDRQELRHRSGFFVLDADRLRSVQAGGSLIDHNLAAGSQDPLGPANELVAAITGPVGEYTVVIYNDTKIPMNFRLSVENGWFPNEQTVDQPPQTSPQTSSTEARAASPDAVAVHIVQAGESISLIAQAVYGDLTLYDRLCSYNGIADCDTIEVGQVIRTPALSVLTGSAAPASTARETTSAPPPVAVSTSNATGASYTVVAGDTLGSIAARVYGDFQRFRDICSANGLADCNTITVGQVLRLPAGGELAQTPAAMPPAAPVAVAAASPDGPSQVNGTDIVSMLENSADKSVFLRLWNTTGLTSALGSAGPLTVFAPSDAAFGPDTQANLNRWMDNEKILERLLAYHVLAQAFDPDRASGGPVDMPTLEGATLRVERTAGGGLLVNGARVIGTPIRASNGTIYTIDQVLTPPQ